MTNSIWSIGDNRLAAIYATREEAVTAKNTLMDKCQLNDSLITLIEPSKDVNGAKLEGQSEKIGENMLWLHIIYGAAGLGVGLMVGWLLVNYGPEFARLNPMFTYIGMLSPGLFIGLFLSGLLSLKPQHDAVNQAVVSASRNNDWALVINIDNHHMGKGEVVPMLEKTHPKKIV